MSKQRTAMELVVDLRYLILNYDFTDEQYNEIIPDLDDLLHRMNKFLE